ncbi:arylamine N-acetyltransferase [Mycobacterium shigaense]|uniref:Arylamine N-acetyltransferase n=1 Tax=Mycobacterium shigaense TaxID=722731 RepID=A0A1Z4ENZ1_9MYCO|nr:arylamine N-acetyltransferase [Mycobacterium shigaense]
MDDRGDGLVLLAQIAGEWQPLYEFTTRTHPDIDLKTGSWFVSTHPSSHFVTGLMVALVTDDGRYNLAGRELTIHRQGGSEKILLPDAAAVVEQLHDRFGINIDDVGERGRLESRIDGITDANNQCNPNPLQFRRRAHPRRVRKRPGQGGFTRVDVGNHFIANR